MSIVLDKYTLCYMFTFLVASFLFLFSLLLWRKEKHGGGGGDGVDSMDVGEVNGEKWSENVVGRNDDIIIVGAGVAGSALAYTLGKVTNIFLFYVVCLYMNLCYVL